MLFGGVLLLGCQPLVQKRLFTGKIQINTNSLVHTNYHCFSFFCFVLRRTSNVHFWYMHLTLNCWFINICIWNKRLITGDIRNRGNVKLSDAVWLLCPPRYQGRFDWRMSPNHLNAPQNKTGFSNAFPKRSWLPVNPEKAQHSPAGLKAYPQ